MEHITCEFCKKVFITKYNVIRHHDTCKMKVEYDRRRLSEAIDYIQYVTNEIQTNQLDLVTFEKFKKPNSKVSCPTKEIKQDNESITIFPFSTDRLSEIINNLTISMPHVMKIYKKIVKHDDTVIYRVSDASRKMFYFYDEKGSIVKDMDCTKLLDYTRALIKRRFTAIKKEDCKKISDYHKRQKELKASVDDNTDDDYSESFDNQEYHENKQKISKSSMQTETEYLTKVTEEIKKILDFLDSSDFTKKMIKICI